PLPRPVRLTVFRYCLGMIMSVSTLIMFSGAATPSSVVNLFIPGTPATLERFCFVRRPAFVKAGTRQSLLFCGLSCGGSMMTAGGEDEAGRICKRAGGVFHPPRGSRQGRQLVHP